MSDSIPKSGYI